MTYRCCRHCLHDGDPGEDPENAHTERCPYGCNAKEG